MKIPDNTIRQSMIRTYGIREVPGDVSMSFTGCPMVYRATYVEQRVKETMEDRARLDYGSVVHDALYAAEEDNIPLLPDALEKAWQMAEVPLGPAVWEEAVRDLTAYLERSSGSSMATIAVEQELTMPLMEYRGEQYYFAGRLDKISVDTDDPTVLYVSDYKTNRSPSSQADVDNDVQFTGYMCLVRANLGKYLPGVAVDDVGIVGVMEAVKWYDLFTVRAEWQMEQFLDWLRAITRRIVDDEEGLPVLNEGCGTCELKFDCPEFMGLPGEGATVLDRLSLDTSLEDRIRWMKTAQPIAKAITDGVKTIQEEMKSTLDSDGIVVGKTRYFAEPSLATEWDNAKLVDVLGLPQFLSVANVTQKAVDQVVRKRPDLKDGVEACKTKYEKGVRLKETEVEDGG